MIPKYETVTLHHIANVIGKFHNTLLYFSVFCILPYPTYWSHVMLLIKLTRSEINFTQRNMSTRVINTMMLY